MIEAIKNVWDRRAEITSGYEITWEPPILWHFQASLQPVKR